MPETSFIIFFIIFTMICRVKDLQNLKSYFCKISSTSFLLGFLAFIQFMCSEKCGFKDRKNFYDVSLSDSVLKFQYIIAKLYAIVDTLRFQTFAKCEYHCYTLLVTNEYLNKLKLCGNCRL